MFNSISNIIYNSIYLLLLISNIPCINADRVIQAKELVTCIEDSKISANGFELYFNPDDSSAHYKLNLNTEIDAYIIADIAIYAYGIQLVRQRFNPCAFGLKQFCPLHPGKVEIDSVEYLPREYTGIIPSIAFMVPDLDASAKIMIYDYRNMTRPEACVHVFWDNTMTLSQPGIKWVTMLIPALGFITSFWFFLMGKSSTAVRIGSVFISLFLYFQSVAMISMQNVRKLPPVAEAFAENLTWTLGLIRVGFMQKAFRWFVDATGGSASLYLTSNISSILPQKRDLNAVHDILVKRGTDILYGNEHMLIFRGLKRIARKLNIEPTALPLTSFLSFLITFYSVIFFFIFTKNILNFFAKNGIIHISRFSTFRNHWKNILKGALYGVIYLSFAQISIMSSWEFTKCDSPAVMFLSVILLLLIITSMLRVAYQTTRMARNSLLSKGNYESLLFDDESFVARFGFFYSMFKPRYHWWNIYSLLTLFIKSFIIGLGQKSGKSQSLGFFVLDLVYLLNVLVLTPYLDIPTNIINIFISSVIFLNSLMFCFFSYAFSQSYMISSILGWVFCLLNVGFTFFLLFMIMSLALYIFISEAPSPLHGVLQDKQHNTQRIVSYGSDREEGEFLLERSEDDNSKGSIPFSKKYNDFSGENFAMNDLTPTKFKDDVNVTMTPSTERTLAFSPKMTGNSFRHPSLRLFSLLGRATRSDEELNYEHRGLLLSEDTNKLNSQQMFNDLSEKKNADAYQKTRTSSNREINTPTNTSDIYDTSDNDIQTKLQPSWNITANKD